MELSKIAVQTFKKVKKVELDLGLTNILVGANGSGKSSVLQALHLASCMARQADRVEKAKPNTVSVTEVDYLPSNQYKKLGHGNEWGNKGGSSCSTVKFTFNENGVTHDVEITLRSARNAGISISGSIPLITYPMLRAKRRFFSSYVPGLSGIPNSEKRESKRVVLRASSFGDSNVFLRNVLLILQSEKPDSIVTIEKFINQLIDEIKITVEHDNEKDLEIGCYFHRGGARHPIELLGTGYLQIIQMLSYIFLFEPKLLLIDEPDTHLHPSVQERLVPMLEDAAKPFGTKIIMSTHSPFIVRGATSNTKVFWLDDGAVLMENRNAVEQALGWGALGKKLLIVSEDGNLEYLRHIIRQWPEIERQVALLPGNGFRNLPSREQAIQLHESLQKSMKILVLRDRDCLSDDECKKLAAAFQATNVTLSFTDYSDIEAYFCQEAVIAKVSGITGAEATAKITDIINQHKVTIKDKFVAQRKAHNEEIYLKGGSPDTDQLWDQWEGPSERTTKGKFLFNQLLNKDVIRSIAKNKLMYVESACDGNVALGLKETIVAALA